MADPFLEPYKDPYVEKPDGLFMRGAKAVSLIIVLTALGGLLAGFGPYWYALYSGSTPGARIQRHSKKNLQLLKPSTIGTLPVRIAIGSAAGALFGIGYVIRCIVKREEP